MNPVKKKILVILFLIASFCFAFFFCLTEDGYKIKSIISAGEIELENNTTFSFNDLESFDCVYSDKNRMIAEKLNLTEDEGFILGNFSKYDTNKILKYKKVKIRDNDLVYDRFSYKTNFENSPYCIIKKTLAPCSEKDFEAKINSIRKGKFVLVDLDTDNIYPVSKEYANKLKNFVIVRKNHMRKSLPKKIFKTHSINNNTKYKSVLDLNNIKIIVSDSTTKLSPDRNCSSDICKEILANINNSKETIDMAIYGYSSTPAIEKALKNAIQRGVKIRMVYDIDSQNKNIYPDTEFFTKLITNNVNDKLSPEVNGTMHNKFYIFDSKTVITGSANLSHTDMSGYNSNSILVIKSAQAAKIYKQEFEQMFNGIFHNSKTSYQNKIADNLQVFFSPQDKPITNGVLPLIKNAKKYIYIPCFVITEKRVTDELTNAKNRGVEVKIIVDALNASTKHSKHKLLRDSGIAVKAENYAGKMHSKTIIIDDTYLIIGSMNFSNSGENKNDENLVIIKSPQAAKFYKEFFLYQWNKIPDKWLKYVPRAEGKDSLGSCTDGIDNNYDGLTDLQDKGCK